MDGSFRKYKYQSQNAPHQNIAYKWKALKKGRIQNQKGQNGNKGNLPTKRLKCALGPLPLTVVGRAEYTEFRQWASRRVRSASRTPTASAWMSKKPVGATHATQA